MGGYKWHQQNSTIADHQSRDPEWWEDLCGIEKIMEMLRSNPEIQMH